MLSLIFAIISLTLQANQIATGLALTIFGRGFSALVGAGYVGIPAPTLPKLHLPVLSDLPVLGPMLFDHDILVYLALVSLGAVAWCIRKTHVGLVMRAVGDSHDAAHALGYRVIAIRYAAVAFGGALAGLGGAYMSLAYTPMWAQDMTAGARLGRAGTGHVRRLAAVLAADRRLVFRRADVSVAVCAGAGPAGAVGTRLGTSLRRTVVVLVLISRDRRRIRLHRPAMLGRPFQARA